MVVCAISYIRTIGGAFLVFVLEFDGIKCFHAKNTNKICLPTMRWGTEQMGR